MRGSIVRVVLFSEARYVSSRPGFLLIVPVVLGVVPLTLLPYIADAVLPGAAAALFIASPLFTNTFGERGNEIAAYHLFPAAWEEILIAKNLVAGTFSLMLGGLATVTLWTFSVQPPDTAAFVRAVLLWLTLLFPLLSAGNFWSVQEQHRRRTLIDAAADGCVFLVLAATLSMPYLVIVHGISLPVLCVPYAAASALVWYWWSIPRATRLLHRKIVDTPEDVCLP